MRKKKSASKVTKRQSDVPKTSPDEWGYNDRHTYYSRNGVIVYADLWYKTGDHPNDRRFYVTDRSGTRLSDGYVVQRFESDAHNDRDLCIKCGFQFICHGSINGIRHGGHPLFGSTVCPGDYIVQVVGSTIYTPIPAAAFRENFTFLQ